MKYQLRKEGVHVDIVTDDLDEAEALIAQGWRIVRIIGRI